MRGFLGFWAAVFLALGLCAYYLPLISEGGISRYDEFFTLVRSTGFERHNDWLTVYQGDLPNFRKPPLQYWITAFLLELGIDQTTALRLPSMLFAGGTLIATALLAFAIAPQQTLAPPASVLICACSDQFWEYAVSAMLEMGAVFFVTLSVAATVLALKSSRWWYIVAIAIGLGALQKAPIALACVAIFIFVLSTTARLHGYAYGGLNQVRDYRISFWIAIAITFAWPLWQLFLHGTDSIEILYKAEMIARFSPDPVASQRSLKNLGGLLIADEGLWRWPAIFALAWLPWCTRRFELLALPILFLCFVAAIVLAAGPIYPRYSMVLVPIWAAALATVVLSMFHYRLIAVALLATIIVVAQGPIKEIKLLGLYPSERMLRQIEVLSRFNEQAKEDETLVVCQWSRDSQFPPGALNYMMSNDRRLMQIRKLNRIEIYVQRGFLKGPLRGICTPEDLAEIEGYLADLLIVEETAGYSIWTASGNL